jgi:hypothetical protein
MSRDIESNYTDDYWNEDKHCRFCDSYSEKDGENYCTELEKEITPNGNCDFFRSKD